MSIDAAAWPIAWLAGVLSIVSPCVWPLVPVVMASASDRGRMGPIWLGLGLSLAFAISGTFLTFILIGLGLDPDAFRPIAAVLLVMVGLLLVFKSAGDWLALRLSGFVGRFKIGNGHDNGRLGQLGVGLLLGLVWLPCVGPTLGAAIALASVGQDFTQAFLVMLAFGVGTSTALIAASFATSAALSALRPGLLRNAAWIKSALGLVLVVLGLMVLTGLDKRLETFVLPYLPDVAVSL